MAQAELNPEEELDPEDIEGLMSSDKETIESQNKTGQVLDFIRPTPQDKTRFSSPAQAPTQGQVLEFKRPKSKPLPSSPVTNQPAQAFSSRGSQIFTGLKNFGQRMTSLGQPPTDPEEEKRKLEQQKKKDLNKKALKHAVKGSRDVAAIAGSGGTNVLAWASAAYNFLAGAIDAMKANWKPILLGVGAGAIALLIAMGIFTNGFLNLSPGTKSGITFAQSETNLSILTDLRLLAEGNKTDAIAKELSQGGINKLKERLTQLATEVETKQYLQGTELDQFKSQINNIINLLTAASATQLTEEGIANLITQMQPIAQEIVKLYDTVLEKTLGSANSESGFYQLPDLPYYVRKNPSREWGRLELIETIINTAKDFNTKYPKYKIRITDMSLPSGGDIDSHASHECGNDADITVAHVDSPGGPDGALLVKKQVSPGNYVNNYSANGVPEPGKTFNAQMAKDLADMFFANGVAVIGFSYPYNDYPKFEKWSGHEDHFHIRIFNQSNKAPGCLEK